MPSIAEELAALSPEQRQLLELALKDKGIEVDRLQITPRAERLDGYPLSFAQERLWFLSKLDPASSAYHIATPVLLTGTIVPRALAAAVRALVERHEALRTVFETRGGEPVQVVRECFRQPVPWVDLTALAGGARAALQGRLTARVSGRPFDLASEPLLRSVVLRLAEDEHALLLTMHHIVSDGWSMGIFYRELWTLYRAFVEPSRDGGGAMVSPLLPLSLQYVDFALWQRGWLDDRVLGEQLAYWRRQLAGAPPALTLPIDHPRPPLQTSTGGAVALLLDAETTARARQRAREAKSTLFVLLLATFQAFLSRLTHQTDVVVGTASAGRNREEIEPLIGFFVNTLALRTRLGGAPGLSEATTRAKAVVEGANAHADLPFARLVAELVPERTLDQSPIFQVDFSYQAAPAGGLVLEGLGARMLRAGNPAAQFDLSLNLTDRGQTVTGALVYNADLLEASTVERWAGYLRALLRAALADPQRPLASLPLLAEAERQQVLFEWGAHTATGPASTDLPVTARIAEWAARQPSAVAVLAPLAQDAPAGSSSAELTYAELAAEAGQLAARLQGLGVGPEQPVGVCLTRGPRMVPAMLAVLAAGGYYVPLDPDYPPERLRWMIADAALAAIVTESAVADRLPAADGIARLLLDEPVDQPADAPMGQLDLAAAAPHPASTAYSIYTSGSTGTPKGVLIPHAALAAFAARLQERFGWRPGDRILQFASINFDASVEEIFGGLAAGATLVLRDDAMTASTGAFLAAVREQALTVLDLPTAFWHELTSALDASALDATMPEEGAVLPESLHTVIIGGEAALPEMLRRWRARVPARIRLINTYGPTESTVTATCWFDDRAGVEAGSALASVPIGMPLPGYQCRVLDAAGLPVGLGVSGELCLGGPTLARGYHQRPALTAARFVPDGYAAQPGARLYRSGDLVRRRPDGPLEFLGRLDGQVKVRGFRIEPGEVEAVLSTHPALAEVAVAAVPADGGTRLIAYLVAAPSSKEGPAKEAPAEGEAPAAAPLAVNRLRGWLLERLPEYMVPTGWQQLDALPRTPAGKLDRRALAAAAGQRVDSGVEYVAPTSEVERQVAAIWRELLGVEQIGLEHNFFDLGGHSLLLIRMQARLREELGRELPVVDLFRFSTVRRLAQRLQLAAAEGGATAETASEEVALGRARAARRLGKASGVDTVTDPEVAPADRLAVPTGAVAIVGMAGRFPSAPDLDRFWENLRDGVEGIRFYSDEELSADGVPAPVLENPSYIKAQGLLDGVDLFDAPLFGYSAREAQMTDPQHRIFLECSWSALEDAGYSSQSYRGAVGVYGGTSMSNYWLNLLTNPGLLQETGQLAAMLGNDRDFLPTRVSYKLDLTGPSFNVQTACSTSLVATHLACQALLAGQCDMALAGGVSAGGYRKTGYWYQDGGILSPDGHCRAFDAAGAGVIASNGVGIVVLKRLEDAMAAGDTIRAVIRGSAINNDGANKVGFTAPSVEGQARVIAEALAVAGVEPATIDYVEAHGTATPLGDPIEVAALTEVFGRGPDKHCGLGSVKTNIGHADSAAGVAGLIKTVLALQHRELPPSLNFETPNPAIDFEHNPFYVVTERTPWRQPEGRPRRAGVSSFGLGGTNAHLVLEEWAPERRAPAAGERPARPWQLLTLSAATPDALEAVTDAAVEVLSAAAPPPLADVAFTYQAGRSRLGFRRVLVAGDAAEAAAALASRDPRRLLEGAGEQGAVPVAFLLPGVGDHYPGMAAELYHREPAFRTAVDACAEILTPLLGEDPRPAIFGDRLEAATDGAAHTAANADGSLDLRAMLGRGGSQGAVGDRADRPLSRTRLAQPAVFTIDYALAQLWRAWGIVPEALIGYSLGEYVAACLAGVLSLADALTLVAERALLIDALPAGAMVAVPLPAVEAAALATEGVALAATNAPGVSVLAGPPAEVDALVARLEADGVVCQRLATRHAFHSPMMRPAAEVLTRRASALALAPPRIPYVSNVTGRWMRPEEATDPAYWARHLCGTVRFAEGLETLVAGSHAVLLEVGPGQALSTAARQHSAVGAERVVVASLRDERQQRSDEAFAMEALGRLWLAGVQVDWQAVAAPYPARRIPLPTYPFERQRYWLERPGEGGAAVAAGGNAGVAPSAVAARRREGRVQDLGGWFHLPQWLPTAPPDSSSETLRARVAGRWWIVPDTLGVADRLASRLEELGAEVRWLPIPAATLEAAPDGAPAAAPDAGPADEASAWRDAVHGLDLADSPPRFVLHLAALTPPELPLADAAAALAAQRRGLLPLLGLVRALIAEGFTDELRLAVVSSGLSGGDTGGGDAGGSGRPEHATMLGALRVLPQEYRNLDCLAVDLDLDVDAELTRTAGGTRGGLVIDRLLADLAGATERRLRYRRGGRDALGYLPVPLPGDERRPGFEPQGVYLLTGAFGLVGRTLSSWLAERYQARLVLVGRTPVPPSEQWNEWLAARGEDDPTSRRIGHLQSLVAAGGEVLTVSADVADPAAMGAALSATGEHFGRLDGVLHLAGATGQEQAFVPLERTDRAAVEQQLAPKMLGVCVLHQVLQASEIGRQASFVALFSSMSSVLGGLGFTAYAAANAFLDAFAAARYAEAAHASVPGPAWMALDWDGWRPPGQEASPQAISMSPEEATEALRRALTLLPAPQVVVSVGELEARLARWVRFEGDRADSGSVAKSSAGDPAPGTVHARPAHLQTPYVAPRGETEATIAGLWGRMLGIEGIGVHDNFFQLGGDSLLATQLASRLRAALKVEVPLRVFFAAPTVAQMAAELASGGGEMQEELAEIEAALREIEGLSLEEIARELGDEVTPAPESSRAWAMALDPSRGQSEEGSG